MTAHTPGPWDWHGPYMTGAYKVTALAEKGPISLKILVDPTENGNAQSNAMLIASAPDLLQALSLAVATIERLANTTAKFESVGGTLNVCRAALAKAGAV